MGLTKPGNEEVVAAAASEFIKLCYGHGLTVEEVCQASISVAASVLTGLHKKDKAALERSLKNYLKTLRSACELFAEK